MSTEDDYTHEPEHDHLLDREFIDDEFDQDESGSDLDEDEEQWTLMDDYDGDE